jgi:hypothetical protein
MFLLEDDQVSTGDPFSDLMDFMNFSPEIADATGAVCMNNKQSGKVREEFYKDNSWLKNFDATTTSNPPSLGMNAHGQCSLISKKAWKEFGGYDERWHGFDQCLSYKIWLSGKYIIWWFPNDPLIHCGACAQCADFYGKLGNYQGSSDRCIEIFGKEPRALEEELAVGINEVVVPVWQPKLKKAYEEWKLNRI